MAKQGGMVLHLVTWITGVIVSLAVAFGMTSATLTIPYISTVITQIVGWIVVVTTLLSVILAIAKN